MTAEADANETPRGGLERYHILHEIGRGGQATTYLADDLATGEQVALKELALRRAESWKAVELFEREAEVLRTISHPAIPAYVDAFHAEEGDRTRFFLVQEYVEGRTLRDLWDGEEGLPLFSERQAIRFMDEMLEILIYLHGLNPPVVHRDIKPGNIFRRPDGSYALVDFGAVQAVLPETMGGSTFVGTSGYMPPEQLMGRAAPASDLFALGATVIHMLSGIHPGDLPVRGMRMSFDSVVDVSDELYRYLEDLVAPAVEDRYQTAVGAREDLRPIAQKVEEVTSLTRSRALTLSPSSKVDIERRSNHLEITFPLSTAHPGFGLMLASPLLALGSICMLSHIGGKIVLAVAGVLFTLGALAGFQRPVLRVGPREFELERRRLLFPHHRFTGKTRNLEARIEDVRFYTYRGNTEEKKALLVVEGIDEEILGLKLDEDDLEVVAAEVESFCRAHDEV